MPSKKQWVAGEKLLAADINGNFGVGFGGDGSDGALSITSGVTTLSIGSAEILVKQYTSISITGTGALGFSNPHANGSVVVLKSQGAVAITSSATPGIDLRGMGAAGGAGGTASMSGPPGGSDGVDGSEANGIFDDVGTHGGRKGVLNSAAGAGGTRLTLREWYTLTSRKINLRGYALAPGAGGGGGASSYFQSGVVTGNGGGGGAGGGALLIECAGALNFTGTIDVSGIVGTTSPNVGPGGAFGTLSGGGGGGGATGQCLVLYNTLTSASGTITAAGGAGGGSGSATQTGSSGGGSGNLGFGGGGGGSLTAAGGAGGGGGTNGNAAAGAGAGGGGGGGVSVNSNSTTAGRTGGAGGASDTNSFLVAKNPRLV